jgi:hypothetical protein
MSLELIELEVQNGDMTSTATALTTPIIAIRPATPEDAAAVRHLVALDSAEKVPTGDLLLGVVDGEIRAAMAVDGGRAIADPFHPTSELVSHLELRVRKLRACAERPTRAHHVAASAARRLRRATALRT